MEETRQKFITEPAEAVKKVIEIFGEDILTDHKRFCAAFSDVAPKLSKESKAFLVALSEDAGEIYLSARSSIESGITSPDEVNKRALAVVSEFLNFEKAKMVVSSLSYAMGWGKLAEEENTESSPSTGSFNYTMEDLFRKAEDGDVNAQYNLAERFYFGNGVKHSYSLAAQWFQKAAQSGDCNAQKRLGDCYHTGQGVEKDYYLAAKWYTLAAEQGDYDAQRALVSCYKTGGFNLNSDLNYAQQLMTRYGIKFNYDNPIELLTESAENGSLTAQLKLSDMLFQGKSVSCDRTAAFYWYERAAAQNSAEAQFNLAKCYADGEGTDQDLYKAFYWYGRAAENGNPDAINNLACCYFSGSGTSENPEKAAELYLKAAETGSSQAQYNFGECCYNGFGMVKNPHEAVKWYSKAASQNNPDAQYSLGWCYYCGEGTQQDYNAAKRLFELSAQQRNPHAQVMLAYCYLNGQGTDKNYAKAAEWFGKAAIRGSTEAAQMLVKCLATGGFYLSKDVEKAKRAADKYGVEYCRL